MKDELIKVIAEYLGSETKPISRRGEYFVEFETPVKTGKTRHDYCQEIAAEIAGKVLAVMEDKLKKVLALLEKYEALEAEIIMDDECWMTKSGLPEFTQGKWDKMIELQGERNEILGRFKTENDDI